MRSALVCLTALAVGFSFGVALAAMRLAGWL